MRHNVWRRAYVWVLDVWFGAWMVYPLFQGQKVCVLRILSNRILADSHQHFLVAFSDVV